MADKTRKGGVEPFNNPFAEQARRLKKRLRQTRAKTPPAAPEPAAEQPVDPFDEAVRGAVPLAKGEGRVRPLEQRARAPVAGRRSFAEQLDEHPFDLRFSEGFIRGRAYGVSRQTIGRLERGEFAIQDHVDLHGMALDDARACVDAFLLDAHKQGRRCVLVITGKGLNSPGHVGVLHDRIPKWLARGPSARLVLAFSTARECDGGIGALYVLLRKHGSRKNRIDVEEGAGD